MQFVNQLIQFLQQGIAAIFRFVQLVWTWSVGQITKAIDLPWGSMPIWKQALMVLVAIGVIYVLYRAARELWEAGEKALGALATLLMVFVRTLPLILIAGLIAAGGAWLVVNFNPSFL